MLIFWNPEFFDNLREIFKILFLIKINLSNWFKVSKQILHDLKGNFVVKMIIFCLKYNLRWYQNFTVYRLSAVNEVHFSLSRLCPNPSRSERSLYQWVSQSYSLSTSFYLPFNIVHFRALMACLSPDVRSRYPVSLNQLRYYF